MPTEMVNVTAVATAWTEAPRGTSAAVVLQNQSYGDVFARVQATQPATTIEDTAAYMLQRYEETTLRDFASGDKIWVRSRSETAKVLVWRNT